jgi:hypothetical protein
VLVNQSGVAIQGTGVQEDIPNDEACFETLTRVLRLSKSELNGIYASRAPNWVTLVGEIDAPTYALESEELIRNCAASFGERATRRYVSGGLAPHVTGYVGYPSSEMLAELAVRGVPEDAIIGLTGIERSWDSTLAGQAGGRLQIISPLGDVLRTLAEVPAGRSESVYLTIDSDLQFAVQQALSDAYNIANWAPVARGAAAVIMDVRTGEILALASYPDFDPNLFNPDNARSDAGDRLVALQNNVRNPQINRVTQSAFPPGSTFKIATMLAAADSGVYDLSHTYACSGMWYGSQLGDINRLDWKTDGHGVVNLPQALTGSCDPYFYQTGYDMNRRDPNLFPNYAQRLGFGQTTGLTGLVETPGQVPSPAWVRENLGQVWTTADAVNIAIGLGYLLVTPLQMARLVAAVANGGYLVTPQLVWKAQIIGEETLLHDGAVDPDDGHPPRSAGGDARGDVQRDHGPDGHGHLRIWAGQLAGRSALHGLRQDRHGPDRRRKYPAARLVRGLYPGRRSPDRDRSHGGELARRLRGRCADRAPHPGSLLRRQRSGLPARVVAAPVVEGRVHPADRAGGISACDRRLDHKPGGCAGQAAARWVQGESRQDAGRRRQSAAIAMRSTNSKSM